MNNIKYAPIALFTYNRADHTQAAVESLLRNAEASQSDLFVFIYSSVKRKASDVFGEFLDQFNRAEFTA